MTTWSDNISMWRKKCADFLLDRKEFIHIEQQKWHKIWCARCEMRCIQHYLWPCILAWIHLACIARVFAANEAIFTAIQAIILRVWRMCARVFRIDIHFLVYLESSVGQLSASTTIYTLAPHSDHHNRKTFSVYHWMHFAYLCVARHVRVWM